jgi:hypothetical protein
MAQPAQLVSWGGLQHGGAEGHGATADRLQANPQALAGVGVAVGAGHEWVPLRVGGEVGEDLPDPLGLA